MNFHFTFNAFLDFVRTHTLLHTPHIVQNPSHLNFTPRTNEREMPLHPHADANSTSTHTLTSSTAVFPFVLMSFLPFLLFSHSTSPPPTSSSKCTRSTRARLIHPRSISFSTHPRPILSPPLKTDLVDSISISFPQSHSFFLPLSQFDRVQLVDEWS